MDEITGRTLVEAIRAATEEAARGGRPSTVAVASLVRARLGGPDDPQAALVAAIEYHPVDPASCGRHGRPETGASTPRCDCSRPLAALDTRVFPLLADALAHAPRPLVAARFADVLWTARYGETPRDFVSNSAPYQWYPADMLSEIHAGDGRVLIRVKAGPPSGSLVVNRLELCLEAR